MGIRLILRTKVRPNLFSKILIDTACSNIGDEILICSGFFQEDGKYPALGQDGFVSKFKNANKKIITIGIHNNSWRSRYINFVNTFRKAGIPIRGLIKKGFHWHAKVYLLYLNSIPIFGIIGSSNITRPAFDDTSPFNIEADVILWNDDITINNIIEKHFSDIDINDYYVLDYENNKNQDKTIQDRLMYFHKIIREEGEFTEVKDVNDT
jgi:hypothetical protein